jgi:hypothetical protein
MAAIEVLGALLAPGGSQILEIQRRGWKETVAMIARFLAGKSEDLA